MSSFGTSTVDTPTATAGLIAERARLERELIEARKDHKAKERTASAASHRSMKAYYAACDIERTLDLVEESLTTLGTKFDPRAEGAERMRGKYADNKPSEVRS